MTRQQTILWIMAAGMVFIGTGACGGKSAAPSGSSGSGQSGAPKIVLGETALNGTVVPNTPEDGKPVVPETDPGQEPLEASPPSAEATLVKEAEPGAIIRDPARFTSGTVMVRGVFQGWRGSCRGGPPVSRGDWMIADSTGCLYVHGPMPPGLDPARPSGERISVSGTVRLKNGFPYLETEPSKP